MTKTFKTGLLCFSALSLLAVSPAAAEEFSATQKEEIGALVKSYLLENPGVIFEAVSLHEANMKKESAEKAAAMIEDNYKTLNDPAETVFGNKDGDITIVEFFDYNCGYCKRALPDLQKVVEDDPNVRIVFKEMPILGPTSRTAATWALAAKKQGKYFEYHTALMDHAGPKEEGELEKIARNMGLDVEKMKVDANSQEINQQLAKDMELSQKIGVQGTPAFVIGKTFIPGYVGVDGLKDAVAKERAKKADKEG